MATLLKDEIGRLSVTIPQYPTYIGNPIYITGNVISEETEEPMSNIRIRFMLRYDSHIEEVGRQKVYNGIIFTDINGNFSIRINELLEPYILKPEAYCQSEFEKCFIKSQFELVCLSEYANAVSGKFFYVMPGRITNALLRELNALDQSIYTVKWFNHTANFSSLVGGTNITLYESEVMPIRFIGSGADIDVSGDSIRSFATEYMQPYMMNLSDIVAELGNELDFRYDKEAEEGGFSVSIEPDPEGSNISIFEYRNSFGVFERFLATGDISQSVSVEDNNDYNEVETFTNTLIPANGDKEYSLERTINTGYLTKSRLERAISLITSSEVYLVRDGYKEKVKVTSSESVDINSNEPQSLSLKVEPLSTDDGYISNIARITVHNQAYAKTYN